MEKQDNVTIPNEKDSFRIGLVGEEKDIRPYVEMFSSIELSQNMPWLHVAAVACSDHGPFEWGLQPAPKHYNDTTAMLEEVDDLHLLIDLETTSCPKLGVPCVSSDAARLFVDLVKDALESRVCATDLIYANSLFRTIFEEVEEDILLLDADGVIVDTNKNVYERKNVDKEDVLGAYCQELEGREFCCDNMGRNCPLHTTLRTGGKAESVHTFVDEGGRMRYFRIYTYPVFNAARQLTHVMEIRRDITHRKNMELRLQQSEKMAAIGELATYIAHEIRNPLFAIGGFANSLLRAPSLDDTAREKVGIILQESKRLDKILKSILNFARPTDARQTVVDLNQVVADTTELMTLGCEDKGITVNLDLGTNLAKVKGDAEMLKQCLINMFKNAIEAMPEGGELSVKTHMTSSHVAFELKDTGRGIPQELREKVFNPFFSTKEQGAGLGLPMTKKIIEEMGGNVELHSKQDEGTRVVLHLLPLLAVDNPEQGLPPEDEASE